MSFDNKKFFRTHADMNRYARFLRLMIIKIMKFLIKKRLLILRKGVNIWKGAIYDFLESNLQNEHVNKQLVDFDSNLTKDFSLQNEKAKLVSLYEKLQLQMLDERTGTIRDLSVDVRKVEENEEWYNDSGYGNISSWPLQFNTPLPFLSNGATDTAPATDAVMSVPPYDPAKQMKVTLPPLLPLHRPRTFKERLQFDLAQSTKRQASPTHHRDISNEDRSEFNKLTAGPTSTSYWMIPSLLLIGDVPFGAAELTEWKLIPSKEIFLEKSLDFESHFPIELKDEHARLESLKKSMETKANSTLTRLNSTASYRQEASFVSVNGRKRIIKERISCIASMLLTGVNTFISILTPEEEQHAETFYKCEESLQHMITNALSKSRLSASNVIIDNEQIIEKQSLLLEKIPLYGKSDPRYPAANRERVRCQARIALATTNIERIKLGIQNLPDQVEFFRLPIINRPFPWSVDDILPSIWQVERILSITQRKVYFYGGGLATPEDGPGRDGRVGTLATIIMARIYHLDPQDALFRWQQCHNAMSGLSLRSKHSYPYSCPPLQWQKQLIIDTLQRSHVPLDYPIIRAQWEPDRFSVLEKDDYDESLQYQVYDENKVLTPRTKRKQLKAAAAEAAALHIPGIKIRGGKQEEEAEEKSGGFEYQEAQRQEAILTEAKGKMKQSLYFHHELGKD